MLRASHRPARILVIGATGFLGDAIVRALPETATVVRTHCSSPASASSLRFDFFDDEIAPLLDAHAIETVIFAAHVENRPVVDVRAARRRFVGSLRGRRIVYLSSDAVFGGERGMYAESDAPSPRTDYGINLLAFEESVAEHCADHLIIRPSYVMGTRDRLCARLSATRERLERGEAVRLFHDMFKSPLGVHQVADAVVRLGLSAHCGIVHVAGERMSVYDYHRRAMTALGVDTRRLEPERTPSDSMLQRDTSLDTSLWQRLTGTKPASIEESV
jgi:dTDP-4-dehydrorhamnose reductase